MDILQHFMFFYKLWTNLPCFDLSANHYFCVFLKHEIVKHKAMKKNIFILLGLILSFFTSCSSTYFYSTINSSDLYSQKVDNGDFLFENDSLWIAYCFKGESAPIQITVYNKMDEPLYVDWQRSALIIDDQAISYGGKEINASIFSNSNETNVGLMAEIPHGVSFIPPKTKVSNSTLRLSVGFEDINKKAFKNMHLGVNKGEPVKVKGIRFTPENTPLSFTSYLTLYTENKRKMVYEQDFYIANLLKTNVAPNNLPTSMADRGDLFYTIKPADNTFWGILLGTTVIAGAVAIDAAVGSNCCYDY